MYALEVCGSAPGDRERHPLGAQPLLIGRADTNQVVLRERTVSSRHLAVWVSAGEVIVEDLRSRNGTFLGEQRLREVTRVEPGDVLRLGESTCVTICRTSVRGTRDVTLALEDLRTGTRHPLTTDRMRLGDGDAEVPLDGATGVLAVVMLHDRDEAWLCEGDHGREIGIDERFDVFGRSFALRCARCDDRVRPTVRATRYPYHLEPGPSAGVRLRGPEATHRIDDEEASALLRCLGHRRQAELDDGLPSEEAGWVDDREVLTAVWGDQATNAPLSRLHTLIARVRRAVRGAGFDPLFLEKRRGALRARIESARIEEER